jgi:hypothetical protein
VFVFEEDLLPAAMWEAADPAGVAEARALGGELRGHSLVVALVARVGRGAPLALREGEGAAWVPAAALPALLAGRLAEAARWAQVVKASGASAN